MSVFLEPFWASIVTAEDGGYLISDATLHLVDASIPTDRDGVFLGNVIDTVWDGV